MKEGTDMGNFEGDRGLSAGSVLLAFVAGAAVGAAAALLLAPQSGSESREQIRRYARRTQDSLRDLAGKAGETVDTALQRSRETVDAAIQRGREAVDTAVQRGREVVEEQKTVLGEALEAGREAMRRERERRTGS
jgi:gas vesicle protein